MQQGFKGDFAFLSNMFPCNVPINSRTFSCTEIPYQACKFERGSEIRKRILNASNGYEAKKLAKGHSVLPDFHERKLEIMRKLLDIKFSPANPQLVVKLLQTGQMQLIEYNTWNDKFWGVCVRTGQGENNLGKLLMARREVIWTSL